MKERAIRTWRYLNRIYDAFGRHFGGLMAAAVSYFALLSVIPLLSVGVAVLGWFVGGSEAALSHMADSIRAYMPTENTVILEALKEIKRERGWLGLLGFVGLLLSGSAIFTNLEIAFNNIWGVTVTRHWFKQRLLAMATSVLVLSLLLLSVGVTSVLTYLQSTAIPVLDYVPAHIPYLWKTVAYLVTFGLSAIMFTLMYKVIPNKPILWREAVIGGVFAGVSFEVAKYLFALYLSRFDSYNKVYHSLASLVILMVWTYYSMTILFLGAEIAADCGTKLPAAEQEGLHHPVRIVV